MKTEREEKLWAVEKWKSKSRIPTFPPPRKPAAQGTNHLIQDVVHTLRRRSAASRSFGRTSVTLRAPSAPPKLTDRRLQDHCPENGLLSCHGPVDSAYGAVCFGSPSHRTLHLCQVTPLSWHIGITITRTLQLSGPKGTFLLCWEGGHFYFALTAENDGKRSGPRWAIILSARADVAKLADALDLGSSSRKGV